MTFGVTALSEQEMKALCIDVARAEYNFELLPLRLLATIAARDEEIADLTHGLEQALDTIQSTWDALAPVERGRSTLASALARRLADKDAEIARPQDLVDAYRGDVSALNKRIGELETGDVYLNRAFAAEAALRDIAAVENESCTWPVGAMKMIKLAKEALR
jgi:hypothetical protein